MGYKKCIAKGIGEMYFGESVEVHSNNYEINEAYIDDKGRLIVDFEWLSDLQAWNRNARKSVQVAYSLRQRKRYTRECCFLEDGYKHQLYGNDFDLELSWHDCHLYDTDDYARCSDCGNIFEKDDMEEVDGELVCNSCLEDDYDYCDHCDSWHKREDMVEVHTSVWGRDEPYWVCEDCARSVASRCYECGKWYEDDCIQTGSDGRPYCEDCFDRFFVTCECCGEVIDRDYAYYDDDEGYYYCEDCWNDHQHNGIRSYHNNPHLEKHYDPDEDASQVGGRFIGSEIETEGGDNDNIDTRVDITREWGHDEDDIYQMHDGSLSDDGIECITQPMTKAYWDKFPFEGWMEDLRKHGAISHDSPRCGLHVHLSREWMNTSDRDEQAVYVARMRQFIADNQEWVEKFCRRTANHWCEYTKTFDKGDEKPKDKNERKEQHKEKGKRGDRYQSVNNTNSATIEFRIFKGTLIANTYRASVEFCLRLVDYIITHEEGTETLYDFLHYKPLPESMSKYLAQRHINF